MYEYPFGNGQHLNLDWFLSEWKNLLAAWEAEKNGIEGALQAEIDRAEAALADVFAARDAAAQSAANALESKNAAAQSASDASGYLSTVQQNATAAQNAAQSAAQSESNAAESAQTALASKNAAGQSERNAAQSEANANSSKNAAAQSASDADASKSAAAQSAADADASKSAAAQSAEDAEAAANSVEASAQQITTNASDINALKEKTNNIDSRVIDIAGIQKENSATSSLNYVPTDIIDNIELKKGDALQVKFWSETTTAIFCYIRDSSNTTVSSGNFSPEQGEITLYYTAPNDMVVKTSFQKAGTTDITVNCIATLRNAPIKQASNMIAPVLDDYIAITPLVINNFVIIYGYLYRITAPVAAGGTITVGTNAIRTTIADVLKSILN